MHSSHLLLAIMAFAGLALCMGGLPMLGGWFGEGKGDAPPRLQLVRQHRVIGDRRGWQPLDEQRNLAGGQTLAPVDAARRVYRSVRQFPRIRKLPAFSAFTSPGTGQLLVPVGETYHGFQFGFSVGVNAASEAQVISDIAMIHLIVDGDPMIEISGEELIARSKFYETRAGVSPVGSGALTSAINALIVTLNLCRPHSREIGGEDGPAWGTSDVRSFQIVVDIAGGASIDGIVCRAFVTDGEPMGRHLTIRRKPDAFTATGLHRVSDWKRDIGTTLLCIHVKKVITDIKLTVDNIVELDIEQAFHRTRLLQYERTPQTNWVHLDFAYRNRIRDGIPMIAGTMDLDLTFGTAPNGYTMLLEQIEGDADAAA